MSTLVNKMAISAIAATFAFSVIGCSSSGRGGNNIPPSNTSSSGGVIDGYVKAATVFVDENNNSQDDSNEQHVTTDDNGDFTLNTTSIVDGTIIYAYGGIDLSTNAPFRGKLSAVYDSNNSKIILSPLTTYVTALVKENNTSLADAKTLVAQTLGLNPADVTGDPMENPTAFLAAQKIQKTVEVVATATGGNFIESSKDAYGALAKVTTPTSSDFNASALVAQVSSDKGITIDANVTKFLTAYTSVVNSFSDKNISVGELNSYGNILDSYAKVAQSAIENNTSLATVQTQLEDLNTTKVAEEVAAGNYTDPVVAATDEVENALDNNVSYLGSNSSDNDITHNLVLTDPAQAPFNTNDLNLTWSSTDNAVVSSVTGAVTRNYLNDVKVILSATVANSLVTEKREHLLTVKRIEVAPTAQDVNISLNADTNKTINLAGKIADLNNDALTVSVSTPSHGTASVVNGNNILYIPTIAYNGTDMFTYTVTDPTGRTATATVNVTVNKVTDISSIKTPTEAQILISSPTATADVSAAKNMFAQLRETVLTFVDLDVNNTRNGDVNLSNTSTLVGTQYDTMKTKLQPAIDTIVSDFNSSLNNIQTSTQAFADAVNTGFNTTVSAISNRVEALATKVNDNNYTFDTNWTVSAANGDKLDHNVTVANGIETHDFVFNGYTATMVKPVGDNPNPSSINGNVELIGTNYDLKITKVSFNGLKAVIEASGTLTGDNGAKMDLSELNVRTDENLSVDAINAFQNISAAFHGTITAAGRTLKGLLSTNGYHTIIAGTYTGASGEPNLDGNMTLNTGLNGLLDAMALQNATYVDAYSPIIVAHFPDGSSDVVVGYTDQYVSNGNNNGVEYQVRDYNLTLQTHDNVLCETNTTQHRTTDAQGYTHYTDVNNTVTCQNEVTLTPYYTLNGQITMKVHDQNDSTVKEMVVGDSWINDYYDNGVDRHIQVFDFRNDGHSETYHQGDKQLYLNGHKVTLSDVNLTQAPDIMDRNFDFKVEGAITDGAKTVKATAGVVRAAETKLYAKNLEVTDASSYVKVAELSATLTNPEFIKKFGSTSGDSGSYYGKSRFENFYISYNKKPDNNGLNQNNVTAAVLNGVNISILDTANNPLTVDANLSVSNIDYIIGNFDGSYAYNGASFVGHIDTNLTQMTAPNGDTSISGQVNSSGAVAANGFEPFSILTNATFTGNTALDVYGLFTRSGNYKIGVHVNHTEDSNGSNAATSVDIGDTNGVLGHAAVTNNAPFTMLVKDKDGHKLADVGETATGNNWEIKYSDNSSETLF
jgi:hypothetical protein